MTPNINTDSEGYYWAPTPYLEFRGNQLYQWWEGTRSMTYGEMAHGPVSNTKGEWREVKRV